jgi:hypothetical protein
VKKFLVAAVMILLIAAPTFAENKHVQLIQIECANKHVSLIKESGAKNCSCEVNGKVCVCEEGRCPSCALIPTASTVRYKESFQYSESGSCPGGNCSQTTTVRGFGIFRR